MRVKWLLLLITISLSLSSCKRYAEDDNLISLKRVKARLVGEWVDTQFEDEFILEFKKNGDLVSERIFDRALYFKETLSGTWSFDEKKEKLTCEYTQYSSDWVNDSREVTVEYYINKLTKKEMWLCGSDCIKFEKRND